MGRHDSARIAARRFSKIREEGVPTRKYYADKRGDTMILGSPTHLFAVAWKRVVKAERVVEVRGSASLDSRLNFLLHDVGVENWGQICTYYA